MIRIEMERSNGNFGFDVKDESGHLLQTDSSTENGGKGEGFRPMQLLLAALGSCSAIDIVSILKKQRQNIEGFRIVIEGEREKDVIPALWKTVVMKFYLQGAIETEKAQKAAKLSVDKYCSVAETLRRAGAVITWEVNIG